MSTIMRKSELVRRALEYLDGQRHEHPETGWRILLDETAMRFNLSPADALCLEHYFLEAKVEKNQHM